MTSPDPSDTPFPPPMHEGFVVQMSRARQKTALRRVIQQELGRGWRVSSFSDEPTNFEIRRPASPLGVDEAWQATYRLRAQPGVLYAEPVFAVSINNRADWGGPVAQRDLDDSPLASAIESLCFEPEPLPSSSDPEWSLRATHVFEAWQDFFANTGRVPGEGIIIGHPDTGYRDHPEIIDNLLVKRGFDFVSNDPDATDDLDHGPLLQPGHGTGTASVIISPKGAPDGAATFVTGVAPGARLIPIRVTRSVVLLMSIFNLAHAIEYASDQGAHVISISLGGFLNWRLHQAIRYAHKRGVIVLAAAGNCVRFVAWPAAYSEVIAVAASNADGQTWRGSSRGSAVDVTAPGESVWCARVSPTNSSVSRGSGTSFAVATTAGIAALWLARHGRDNLIQRYGAEKLPAVFQQILRDTCTPISDPSWTPGEFGAGLVNAKALLAAELPGTSTRSAIVPTAVLQEHAPVDAGGPATFAHLFEQGQTSAIALEGTQPELPLHTTLAALLNTSIEQLPMRLGEVGQELAFHLATNPALYKQFQAALRPAAPASTTRGALEMATADERLGALRSNLVAKGVSPALEAKLTG